MWDCVSDVTLGICLLELESWRLNLIFFFFFQNYNYPVLLLRCWDQQFLTYSNPPVWQQKPCHVQSSWVFLMVDGCIDELNQSTCILCIILLPHDRIISWMCRGMDVLIKWPVFLYFIFDFFIPPLYVNPLCPHDIHYDHTPAHHSHNVDVDGEEGLKCPAQSLDLNPTEHLLW